MVKFAFALAVIATAVCLGLFASSASAAEQCGKSCQARHERIMALSEKTDSGMFRMNFLEYKDLVMTRPRNYNTIFVLNALNPRRGCAVCRQAYEEFKVVVSSFYQDHPDQREKWFFATVDMDGNEQVFKKLKTQSVLMYFHTPESGTPIQNRQQLTSAGEMVQYITSVTGLKFTLHRPPNYFMMIVTLVMLGIAGAVAYLARNFLSSFLRGVELWTYLGLGFTFLMLSGHMWLQIRGAPFAPPNGGFFSDTTQYMYGVESYILIALYAGVTFSLVFLNTHAFKQAGESQAYLTIAGAAGTFLFFALLVHAFATKSRGYPYRFF